MKNDVNGVVKNLPAKAPKQGIVRVIVNRLIIERLKNALL